MSSSLRKRLNQATETAGASGYDVAGTDERPTVTEIWLWKIEDSVKNIVKYPHRLNREKPENEDYDHHFLYAHRDVLKTEEDVLNASDDVLLEALGLSDVEHWGWLQFMVRDFNWVELLAGNWGLPCLACEFGGSAALGLLSAEEGERRARAAFYFLDLMRERGVDPLADLRERAQAFMEENGMSEEEFVEHLREQSEWDYFVYTCESVVFRPGTVGEGNKCLYRGDAQIEYLGKIRRAARRRRQLAGVVN